jgi:nucleoporin SEH1
MMDDLPVETEQEGFMLLQHGHRDMIEATAFNSYGDRFASSSVDGKIKVYNRHKDGSWNLNDTWGAHTAEILQVSLTVPVKSSISNFVNRSNGSHQPSTPT